MALVRDRGLITGLAVVALELHRSGGKVQYDIHITELIDRYFASVWPKTPIKETDYDHANLILRDVRRELREGGVEAVLVNQFYFVQATIAVQRGDTWPTDHKQAKTAIPRGPGNVAAGLHFHNGPNDLIWEVAKKLNVATGAGKVKHNVEAVLRSAEAGTISMERAGEIVRFGARRMTPTLPEVEQEALKAIAPFEEDEI
jgi:hypothetical protein